MSTHFHDDFTIRIAETEQDFENYYRVSFHIFKWAFYSDSTESDEELYKKHKEELGQIDFSESIRCLFVAHDKLDTFAGAVWVGIREDGDVWDDPNQLPVWVYDVEVVPKFKGLGLGKALMLQAEQWAREVGNHRIGLHTSHELEVAINMYRSMNYVDTSYILRKEIEKGEDWSPPDDFTIRERFSGEPLDELKDFRITTFRRIIGADYSLSTLQVNYPRFSPLPDFDNLDYVVFIAESNKGAFAGLVYGRLHAGKAWIGDLMVQEEYKESPLASKLLEKFESWAQEQECKQTVVFIHAKRTELISVLRAANYNITNFYMEKQLK